MFYRKQLILDLQRQLLSNDSKLTWIDLSNSNIDNDDITLIADGLRKNTTLKALSVPQNNITDDGMYNLAKSLYDNSTLTHLDLRRNNIGNYGIHAMAECLCVNDTLQFINFEENEVDDDSIQAMSYALLVNDAIRWLSLTDSTGRISLQERWRIDLNNSFSVGDLLRFLRDRIANILLLLKNASLDPMLVTEIMSMLKPKDILKLSHTTNLQ